MSGVNSNHSENQALIAGRVSVAGAVVAGKGFYSKLDNAGDWTLTFNHGGYKKLISCVVTSEDADIVCSVGTVTIASTTVGSVTTYDPGSTILVKGRSVTNSPADASCDFSFCAVFEVEDA